MLKELKALVVRDKDLPTRAWTMDWREQFRTGAIYDNLPHSFHQEISEADEYIPLSQRAPSVRYGLPEIIVNDSTSLVFDDSHFPAVNDKADGDDNGREEMWKGLIRETRLQEHMLDGAVRGSVGSIVFYLRVLKGRVFWSVMSTRFLTPTWDPEEPDKLLMVEERYKVKGAELRALGYKINAADDNVSYWFRRTWDRTSETYYQPWPVVTIMTRSDYLATSDGVIDAEKTKTHNLGFVPMHWVKNLPGGDDIDGKCTFEAALHNAIEVDYQLSQNGRGLKYQSDPTLLIKDPAYGEQAPPITKGAANAIRVGPEGDVKVLEISGTGSSAVLEYVRTMRELSLELCGGNRASPEKLAGAQSGRAMELMNQSLIWLAGKLRTSYGEYGLLPMLKMVVAANAVMDLKINGETIPKGKLGDPEKSTLSLVWPPFYPPTAQDHAAQAQAISTYREAGVLSQESGVKHIAHDFDIEDVGKEIALIKGEAAEKQARELDAQKQLQASKAPPARPQAA